MIAGQCLAKEMVTILKVLGKIVHVNYHMDCVSGSSQEEEKRKKWFRVQRDRKKVSFKFRTAK